MNLKKVIPIGIIGILSLSGTIAGLSQVKKSAVTIKVGSENSTTSDTPEINLFPKAAELGDNSKKEETHTQQADPTNSNSPVETNQSTAKARMQTPNVITPTQKIKYLAIGDSISAGFNGLLSEMNSGGALDLNTGKITGLSFPAYLAQFFQTADPNRFEAYTNLAKSSSTLLDWNLLLNEPSELKKLSQEERARLVLIFETEDLESLHTLLVEKIKTSNLLTVTLGANDAIKHIFQHLTTLVVEPLLSTALAGELSLGQLFNKVTSLFQTVVDSVIEQQKKLITSLLSLNPNLNINFISYPLPMAKIGKMLDEYLNLHIKMSFSVSQVLISMLNDAIAKTAKSGNVNYIDVYDEPFWITNAETLTPLLFDIHPGAFGYKKMAMDVFVKLTAKELDVANFNAHNWNFGAEHFSDNSFNAQQIVFEQDDQVLYDKVFGLDKNKFLFTEDDLYLARKSEFNWDNYYLKIFNDNYFARLVLNDSLFALLTSSTFAKIDPDGLLKKFLSKNDSQNFKQLVNWLADTNFFSQIGKEAQVKFETTDWNKDGNVDSSDQKLEHLITAFQEAVLKEHRLVKLIKSFLQIPFFQSESERAELAKVLKAIFSNLATFSLPTTNIAELLNKFYDENKFGTYISKPDFETLIRKLLASQNLQTELVNVLITTFANGTTFESAETYQDLFLAFFTNDAIKTTISTAVANVTDEFLTDNEVKQIFTRILLNVVKNLNLSANVDDQKAKILLYNLIGLLQDVNQNLHLVETVTKIIVDQLARTSFASFDLNEFFTELKQKLTTHFSDSNLENLIVLTSNSFLTNANFQQYRADLRKILINFLTQDASPIKTLFTDDLAKILTTQAQKVDSKLLSSALSEIYKTPEFAQFVDLFLDQIFLNQTTTPLHLEDLIKKVFTNLAANEPLFVALNNLIQKLFANETISIWIFDHLTQINANLEKNVTSSLLKTVVSNVLSNQQFRTILDNFVQNAFVYDPNLSLTQRFKTQHLLQTWFNTHADNNQILISNAKELIAQLVTNPDIKNELIKIIVNYSSFLKTNISQERYTTLVSELYDILFQYQSQFNLVEKFVSLFIEEVKNLPTNQAFDFHFFLTKFINNEFKNGDLESKIFTASTLLLGNENLRNFAPEIKQILTNVFAHSDSPFQKVVINFITKQFSVVAGQNETKIAKFVQQILTSTEFQIFTNEIIDSILNVSTAQIKNSRGIIEIIANLLSSFTHNDEWLASVNNLLQQILSNESFQELLTNLLQQTNPVLAKLFDINTIKAILDYLFGNPNLAFVLNNFVEYTFKTEVNTTFDEFAKGLTFQKLLQKWFQDEANNAQLSDKLVLTFENLFVNETVKTKIIDLLVQNSTFLQENIESDTYKQFLSTVYEILFAYQHEQSLFRKFVESFLTQMRVWDSTKVFDFTAFITNFINNEFTKNELENKIFTLTVKYLSNESFRNFAPTIKIIFQNVFTSQNSPIKAQLSNYLTAKLSVLTEGKIVEETFTAELTKLVKSTEFATFISELVDVIFQTTASEVRSTNDLFELIRLIFANLKTNTRLFETINTFINKILDAEFIQTFIKHNVGKIDQKLARNLNASFFKLISNRLFTSQNFKLLLHNFIQYAFVQDLNVNLVEKFSAEKLLRNWLSSPQHNEEIKSQIKLLILDVLQHQTIKGKTLEIVKNYIPAKWFTNLDKEKLDVVLANFYDVLVDFQGQVDISGQLLDALIAHLQTATTNSFNFETFLHNWAHTTFDKTHLAKYAGKLFESILSSNLLVNTNQNTTYVETLVDFILNIAQFQYSDALVNYLTNLLTNLVNKNDDEAFKKALFTQLTKLEIFQNSQLKTAIISLFVELGKYGQREFSRDSHKYTNLAQIAYSVGQVALKTPDLWAKIIELFDLIFAKENVELFLDDQTKPTFEKIQEYISYTDILTRLKELFKSEPARQLLEYLFRKGIFTQTGTVTSESGIFAQVDFANFDFAAFLANQGNFNEISSNLKQVIYVLFKNPVFKTVIKDNILTTIYTNFGENAKNSDNRYLSESLRPQIGELLFLVIDNLQVFDERINFIPAFINVFLNALKNKQVLDLNKILNEFVWEFFAPAKLPKFFVRLMGTYNQFTNLTETINKFKNIILGFLASWNQRPTNSVTDLLWELLPAESFKAVVAPSFTKANLHSLLDRLFANTNSSILANFIHSVIYTLAEYDRLNANNDNITWTTITDFFGQNLDNPQSVQSIQLTKFVDLVNEVAASDEVKLLIQGLINYNIGKYGIDVGDERHTQFINNLHQGLPEILNKLHIVESFYKIATKHLSSAINGEDIGERLFNDLKTDLNLFTFKTLAILLNSQAIIKSRATLTADLNQIVDLVTSDKHYTNILLGDFGLVEMIKNFGVSEEQAKELWYEVLVQPLLSSGTDNFAPRRLLKHLLNIAINHGEIIKDVEFDRIALATIFKYDPNGTKPLILDLLIHLMSDKHKFRNLISKILLEKMSNDDPAKPQRLDAEGKMLPRITKSFNFYAFKNATDGSVNDPSAQAIIDHFVMTFFYALRSQHSDNANNSFLTKIINNVYTEVIKELKTFDNLGNQIKDAVVNGLVSELLENQNSRTITISKLISSSEYFGNFTKYLNPRKFANMVNLLFDASPEAEDAGIFAIIYNKTDAQNEEANSQNIQRERVDDGYVPPEPIKFSADFFGILNLVFSGGLKPFVARVLSPLFKNYINEVATVPKYQTIAEAKNNSPAWRAINRVQAAILQMAHLGAPTNFWTSSFPPSGFEYHFYGGMYEGLRTAWLEAPKAQTDTIRSKYGSNLKIIGFRNPADPVPNGLYGATQVLRNSFWRGGWKSGRDSLLASNFYPPDSLLSYIYWWNETDLWTKYTNSPRKNRQSFIKYLREGKFPMEGQQRSGLPKVQVDQ
ncbi:SGNH/GDSL hydrolase family protein [Mycoplasmopsis columbinasalis]|uniref:Predicted membrane protein n=1 Tax=Mycoplasmopsis columbinasalis TaxID=114880 RepID=A0A449B9H1_9BACT|nr:SGNH/GDSL hydrolase family protein [Mycoplasmopsis columbinasalis]VEU77816.1 Predicted membrane protein [Mycoplasmopsis columbinasalis]